MGLELLVVLLAGVCAAISGWLAARRDRQRGLWAVYGMILGPIALAILMVAPPAVCPACRTRWPGWVHPCPTCAAEQPEANGSSPVDGSATVPAIDRRSPASEMTAAPPTQAGAAPVRGSSSPREEVPAEAETIALATGIFLGGSPPLIIGVPYGIGIRGDSIVVIGPLTTAPGAIVVEQPRVTADISIAAERTLLTAGRRRYGRPEVALIFGSLAVARGIDLEQLIPPPTAEDGPADQVQDAGS